MSLTTALAATMLSAPPKSLARLSTKAWPSALNWAAPPTLRSVLKVIAPTLATDRPAPTRVTAIWVLPPACRLRLLATPVNAPLTVKLPPADRPALPVPSSSTVRSSRSPALTVPDPRTVSPPPNWLPLLRLTSAPVPAVRTVLPLVLRPLPAARVTVPELLLRAIWAPENSPLRLMWRPEARLRLPCACTLLRCMSR